MRPSKTKAKIIKATWIIRSPFVFIINERARCVIVSCQTSLPIQPYLPSRLARSEHPLSAKKPTCKPLCTLKKLESLQTISRLTVLDKVLFCVSLLRRNDFLWCTERSTKSWWDIRLKSTIIWGKNCILDVINDDYAINLLCCGAALKINYWYSFCSNM